MVCRSAVEILAISQQLPTPLQVAYRPENRDVIVELELPTQEMVPTVREYRYVKTRDAINPVARPTAEIRQRYARLVASITLRTLHEIFRATPAAVIEAVSLPPQLGPPGGRARRQRRFGTLRRMRPA
jgi:restriction system protein